MDTQEKKWHIKDLTCFNKPCSGMITKNLEVRWNDDLSECYEKAEKIREKYYVDGE